MRDTEQLAEFAATTRFEDLPPQVLEAVRVYILDNLASGFVGASTPWASIVGNIAREQGAAGPSSVFGRHWKLSPSYAALVNGTIIGGLECDHVYTDGSAHPAAAVFPAVLAIAERDGVDGKSFLTALALGYEVLCRVGRAATRAVEDQRGFHGPGTNAPFGAATGVAKLLGLDVRGVVNALGIAGSHGAGLLEFAREGAMTKRLHAGRGAQMGLESALLAAAGFTGPSTVLEGEHGFLKVYSPAPRTELLTEGLGHRYLSLDMTVKAYPCHVSFHPVIDGIERLRRAHATDPKRLERVVITSTGRMLERRHTDRQPTTILGAQYSLPFSAAVALVRGAEDPRSFDEEVLRNPEVTSLAQRIDLVEAPSRFRDPGGTVAEVSVTLAGHTHNLPVTDWKGAPSNPYTFHEMAEKLRRYVGPATPRDVVEEMVARVGELERERDIRALGALIGGGG